MQFTPQVVLYYKKAMSELQVTVEWLFGREGNYFKLFIDFKNLLRVNMSAVGKFYIVCAPLCKMHTAVCMAILFQTSLVFHLLLCGSIFKEAQGLTAVWAQLILKDSCGTCVIHWNLNNYDLQYWNLKKKKNNSFEDNQAHNVQCIST